MRSLSIAALPFFLVLSLHAETPAGVSTLAVSPDGTVIVAGSPAGIFRSSDGGSSWSHAKKADEELIVASIAFDAATADVFAATSAGLFRSDDRGVTWSDEDLLGGVMPGKLVFDTAEKSKLYVATSDGLYVTTSRGAKWKEISPNGRHFSIRSLAIREKPFTLYVVNEEGLFASTDRGATWIALTDERDDLSAVAFEAPAILHLSTNGSRYLRSIDAGKTWEAESKEWPRFSDFFILHALTYATAGNATWRTTDAGKTWRQWKTIEEFPLRALVTDPKKKDVVWAAALRGIATSRDGGETWSERALPPVTTAGME